MPTAKEEIRRAILGRHPIVYLQTSEEERALDLLQKFAKRLYRNSGEIHEWSCIDGDAKDPALAVQAIVRQAQPGFFVFKDLTPFIGDPKVMRSLRQAYRKLRAGDTFIFIVSPELKLPPSIAKEVYLIELGLPSEDELTSLITRIGQGYPTAELSPQLMDELPVAFKGLTLDEATHALHRVFRTRNASDDELLGEVFAQKANIVRKSGLLEFVPPTANLTDVGGLDNLKDWLTRRRHLFSRQAVADGIPVPKGMLVMGVSGCGKSFAAKAVSSYWKIPLFRLDMSLVFSGSFGTPEASFHRALRTMEALAPGVLWIDEIENSLGMDESGKDTNSQVFSAFLTWMQEKPPLIFVAATANRIQALPAEVIRKGRFDQIYFVDLPNQKERRAIFEIHLRKNEIDLESIDLELPTIATKGFNGAEIEQSVIAARVDAYSDGRAMTIDDLTTNTASIVPLSKTMAEQIKAIRAWAIQRATPASKYGTKPRI